MADDIMFPDFEEMPGGSTDSLGTHPNGKARVFAPEVTTPNEYELGTLNKPNFDYLENLLTNDSRNSKPLKCEHPGTRHRGLATHFIKEPGKFQHTPVCSYHHDLIKRKAASDPEPYDADRTPFNAKEFSGGDNYLSYPIVEGHPLSYRIAKAKQRKISEFNDEQTAYSLGAPDAGRINRKKEQHGPGAPSIPKDEDYWLRGLNLGGEQQGSTAAVSNAVESAVKYGGHPKLHLAHQALVHAIGKANGGAPNKEHYQEKARELGLSDDEMRDLLPKAVQRQQRAVKSATRGKQTSATKVPRDTRSDVTKAGEDVIRNVFDTMSESDLAAYETSEAPQATLSQHYATLGVKPTASIDEIKTAYRKQIKANHPDTLQGQGIKVGPEHNEKIRQIHEAFTTIHKARMGDADTPFNSMKYMFEQLNLGDLPKYKSEEFNIGRGAEQQAATENLMQPGTPAAATTKRRRPQAPE